MSNKIEKLVTRLQSLPAPGLWLNLGMSKMIPFVGTAGVEILEMSNNKVVAQIKNRRKVRNHIGQVHAAAMMLLGETVSGLVVGMNVRDESLPLIKEMKTKFVKRSQGALRATAEISTESLRLFEVEKGEILVPVTVTDESGESPVVIEALWAWVPKKK